MGGVLLSWAVTPALPTSPDKRLAVRTEDHPLSYLAFEGTIPEGYGAGTVMLWDIGHWQPASTVAKGLKKGHLPFRLHGRRLTGGWNLVRMKGREATTAARTGCSSRRTTRPRTRDPVERYTPSVSTGRDDAQIRPATPEPVGPRRTKAPPRFRKVQLATLPDPDRGRRPAGTS